MKCGRCDKELGAADKHNAFYIMNADDPKTFGTNEIEEYVVISDDDIV